MHRLPRWLMAMPADTADGASRVRRLLILDHPKLKCEY